jgi:hypothetical protein
VGTEDARGPREGEVVTAIGVDEGDNGRMAGSKWLSETMAMTVRSLGWVRQICEGVSKSLNHTTMRQSGENTEH